MVNLYEAMKHKKYKILKIDGGYKATKRLTDLGFLKDVIIEKQEMITYGPIKVKVGESIYALGRGIAKKVILEEI